MLYSSFAVIAVLMLIYHSLRAKNDFLRNTLGMPEGINLWNYVNIFKDFHLHNYLFNSIFVLVFSLALLIGISLTTAYGIGRYNFKFRKGVLFYFLIGLMFPIQLGIIPIFILIKNLGLFNTQWSVIIVLGSGISMPVLLLTTFFQSLPQSTYESAKIEGASEWRIFRSIMVPMASSVIFSTCIIVSVWIWNQFFIALVFLQREEVKTMPLLIMSFTKKIFSRIDMALAASVIATIPLLILFSIFSKKIINSIISGGVKG
jgi:raffinose/stachyose/melibiose transport system permease protein